MVRVLAPDGTVRYDWGKSDRSARVNGSLFVRFGSADDYPEYPVTEKTAKRVIGAFADDGAKRVRFRTVEGERHAIDVSDVLWIRFAETPGGVS